jgi:hypothetical protein
MENEIDVYTESGKYLNTIKKSEKKRAKENAKLLGLKIKFKVAKM